MLSVSCGEVAEREELFCSWISAYTKWYLFILFEETDYSDRYIRGFCVLGSWTSPLTEGCNISILFQRYTVGMRVLWQYDSTSIGSLIRKPVTELR
ncbi:hypothetical protein XENTR_v10009869 [Xenopus tropicalis]|nr:hypothetical protein XENTR_v10009869 [Xenopus tropicalis]